LFTGEVTPQRHVAVTLEPAAAVGSLEALRALRVGTVGGTSWEAAARAAGVPAERLDTTLPLDVRAVVAAMAEKRVDVVVTGLAYALLIRREEPRLRLGVLLGEPGYHAYATLPGREALRDALDAYLDGVRDSAGWYRLLIKHFGADAPEMFRRARGE
jgi:ABC-type amino acid transport substrate-binding protein